MDRHSTRRSQRRPADHRTDRRGRLRGDTLRGTVRATASAPGSPVSPILGEPALDVGGRSRHTLAGQPFCSRSCASRSAISERKQCPPTCARCGGPLGVQARATLCKPCIRATNPKSILRSLGLLGNKHIPTYYLRASVDQRRALLALSRHARTPHRPRFARRPLPACPRGEAIWPLRGPCAFTSPSTAAASPRRGRRPGSSPWRRPASGDFGLALFV